MTAKKFSKFNDNFKLAINFNIQNYKVNTLDFEIINGDYGRYKEHLQFLSQFVQNKKIQEVYDHATLYVMEKFSKKTLTKILLVKNHNEQFYRDLQDLLRSIAREIIREYPVKKTINFSYKNTSSWWLLLSANEKEKIIYDNFEKQTNLSKEDIKILNIEKNKITVEFLGEIKPETKAKTLLDMEYFLRKNVESTLELFVEEMKDQSKLRRLYK